ncbi:MAG: hypothetical protein D3926_19320 [Desulfobacteraceae bacterium]|nr:MAG: hypothetical protein D3926_19320 [Desulfobacteraceae bacterium]
MMINRKSSILCVIILGWMLWPVGASAFIPTAPHLLDLVIKKIRQPVGMTVLQHRQVINANDPELAVTRIEEGLYYRFPGNLRSEIIKGPSYGIFVRSHEEFLKIQDGYVISLEKSLSDLYNDILIFRERETLSNYLEASGIDLELTSLQRFNDLIMFVIGRPPEAGQVFNSLWVDQDTFLPRKLILHKEGTLVEIYYDEWERFSKTWYPMQVTIFFNQELYSLIKASEVQLNSDIPVSMFDINALVDLYPQSVVTQSKTTLEEVEELDRKIEEFEKLFE